MPNLPLKIGALARVTDTKVETIRFYEQIGLLRTVPRTEGNYRAYEQSDLNRLSFIRRARHLGFSLDQIRSLLALSDEKSKSCDAVDVIAKDNLAAVERKIADLKRLRRELDRLITRCQCGTIADCRIIDTLSPAAQGAHEDAH